MAVPSPGPPARRFFRWFHEAAGPPPPPALPFTWLPSARCFGGKIQLGGGPACPAPDEIQNCSVWFKREVEILQPRLVIPVGKLAIGQFIPLQKLDNLIGSKISVTYAGQNFDVIPLPHPSGASPWHRMEPGKTLLKKGLQQIVEHSAFQELLKQTDVS